MDKNIFDYQDAIERVGDEELLNELLDDFLDFAHELLVDIDKAVKENDSEKFKNKGHTLKGTAANLSLGDLSNIGLEIENAGKNENTAIFDQLHKKLVEKVEVFEKFMEEK